MMRCSRCSAWPVVRSPDSGTTAAFILQSQNGTLWEPCAKRDCRPLRVGGRALSFTR
jgi:hypothetical protein